MDFSSLDKFMEHMPQRGFPACELAVSRDGVYVYRRGVGYSDAMQTKAVSPNDIYWIFSATKPITCIAAMRLTEQGKLSLEDPVSKYIPEYAALTVKGKDGTVYQAKNVMTVEQLFTMTAGLSYSLKQNSLLPLLKKGDATTLEIVRALADEPLLFEPGTHYEYSLCHDVLAAVIEAASGVSFSEYLSKELFEPLDIHDMGFHPTEEQRARFSAMYSYDGGEEKAVEIPTENRFMLSSRYESGGAGLFSTVDDYMKIITPIACGGMAKNGYRVLSEKSVKMMTENRLDAACLNERRNGRLYGYGWGLCCRVHMNPTVSMSLSPVGEFGWDGAANAYAMIDTENRIAVYFGTHIHDCPYGCNYVQPYLRNLIYECISK